jgi:predicted enzyme related to lactoylglutathione lyase
MKASNLINTVLILMLSAGCNPETNNEKTMDNKNENNEKESLHGDTVPRVTGIVGIFFFSDNPEETKEWYAKNLGLQVNDWGSSFEFRNANRPDEINYLQWSPFEKGSSYFEPSKKEFMINYRVQNLEGMIARLKENGVTVLDDIETYDYGKFLHIMDAEGNKIELWEPVDSVFTQMGGKTTK